jgi:hypothetical protein
MVNIIFPISGKWRMDNGHRQTNRQAGRQTDKQIDRLFIRLGIILSLSKQCSKPSISSLSTGWLVGFPIMDADNGNYI